MENLEKLLVPEEIIIMDSCTILDSVHNLADSLYDCSEFIHLSPEELEKALDRLTERKRFLPNINAYTTPKAIIEIQECFDILNRQQRFHKDRAKGKIKFRRNKRFSSNLSEEDAEYDNSNQELLSHITNSAYDIKRYFEKRDITKKFSEKQTEKIKQMIDMLKSLTYPDGSPLKISYSERYDNKFLRSKQPLNLDADEEIITSAIVLASQFPVTIVTGDSDIRRLLRISLKKREFYEKFWQNYPIHRMRISASYNKKDYHIVYDSDNPNLCEQREEQRIPCD
jgi:hypothetical protein